MTTDLKNKIFDIIKANAKECFICVRDGRDFKADGITFERICRGFDDSNVGLQRKRQIKRETEKLVSEDILIYILGEPPVYIIKSSIKYQQ